MSKNLMKGLISSFKILQCPNPDPSYYRIMFVFSGYASWRWRRHLFRQRHVSSTGPCNWPILILVDDVIVFVQDPAILWDRFNLFTPFTAMAVAPVEAHYSKEMVSCWQKCWEEQELDCRVSWTGPSNFQYQKEKKQLAVNQELSWLNHKFLFSTEWRGL